MITMNRFAFVAVIALLQIARASANQVTEAAIASVGELPGSVGYVAHHGTEQVSAQIGRWDTPVSISAHGAICTRSTARRF
jgi:hypothetical protein